MGIMKKATDCQNVYAPNLPFSENKTTVRIQIFHELHLPISNADITHYTTTDKVASVIKF